MTRTRPLFNRVGDMIAIFGAARNAAAAMEAHRAPHKRDLEILGIDPEAFNAIKR